LVDRRGEPTGEYICTAFCNTSETGDLGDGCAEDQTCFYDLLRSANVHGCARNIDPLGTLRAGEACTADDECRSNSCVRYFTGPNGKYCRDYCGSDSYCPARDTVCRIETPSMNGYCWPDTNMGTSMTGDTCTSDSACDHNFCADVEGNRFCTEACCTGTDCPNGFVCSLEGEQSDSGYAYPEEGAPVCANNNDCPGQQVCITGNVCARILSETSPMCVPAANQQGSRQAGAACRQNLDCASNFCELTLGVCVSSCCNDNVCPEGLTCELQVVETHDDRVTSARVCVNFSTEEVLLRR
jgi:hypothetical protein